MAAGHCGAYLSVHAGVLFEEKGERKSPLVCKSVWDYIDRLNKKAPVFYNYMFSPEDEEVGASLTFIARQMPPALTGTLCF